MSRTLAPTNSVAELQRRAQLYAQGRTPQQQQQQALQQTQQQRRSSSRTKTRSQAQVATAHNAHSAAPAPSSSSPGRSLPYTSAQARMYQLYLQSQPRLQPQHQPTHYRDAAPRSRSRSHSRGRDSMRDDRSRRSPWKEEGTDDELSDCCTGDDHADCISCSSSCSCSSGCSDSSSEDDAHRERRRDRLRSPEGRASKGTMTSPEAAPAVPSDASAAVPTAANATAGVDPSAAATIRSSRRSARGSENQPVSSPPVPAAQQRRRPKQPGVKPATPGGAAPARAVLKRKSSATPAVHTPFRMPDVERARSNIRQQQSFTASPSGSPAAKSARKSSPSKFATAAAAEESKQAMDDTVLADKAAASAGALDATTQQQQQQSRSHPLASSTAVFTLADLNASAAQSASASAAPADAADPAATAAAVASWLAAKEAAQEKARRRQEKAAAKAAADKEAKAKESAAALERWRKKQAEMQAAREAAAAKQRDEEAKAQAEKDVVKAARKAAAAKAYKAFLARYDARAAEASARQQLSASETAQAARDKKRLAKRRFDEWVARKSDWFVGRVQSIKDRQAARIAAAAAADEDGGAMHADDDDPAEEAALDWQWLEREVEQELEAASRARNQPPPPLPVLKTASASKPRRTADGIAERDAALARDQAWIDGVLDSVDLELWNKLMAGIECTRDELDRLRENVAISTGAQQRRLEAGDGAAEIDDAAGVRRAFPTPLRSLHAPEARAMMERDLYEGELPDQVAADDQHAPPLVNVPLHASGFESVQLSQSAAHMYAARQTALDEAAASHGAALDGDEDGPRDGRRASPFPTDAASVAREAQLRPDQYAGSYAALARAKGMDADSGDSLSDPVLSRSSPHAAAAAAAAPASASAAAAFGASSAPRSLPPAVVRSYEAWLRGEMSLAMSVPPPPRTSPTRYGTVAPPADRRDDVNLMHQARTPNRTAEILRAQNQQHYPIATAIKEAHSKRSVNTPSARR